MSAHFARTHVQVYTAVGRIFQESHHLAKVRSGWARLARRNERRKLNQCIFEGLLDLADEAQALAEEEREIEEQMGWYDEWMLENELAQFDREREERHWKEMDAEMDRLYSTSCYDDLYDYDYDYDPW